MTNPRSILITGCSTGIGYEAAYTLRKRGYRVFATARQQKDVVYLKEEGFESFQLDHTMPETMESALAQVLESTGGSLYALFNNGAYGQPGALEDVPTDSFRLQFETNVIGWHDMVCRVLPVMRKQGYGRIIQHGSILGLVSMRFRGSYNATKYALEGYTDTLRQELGGTDIHVSMLNTGPIQSKFAENAMKMFDKYIDVENSVWKNTYLKRKQKKQDSQNSAAVRFELQPDAVIQRVIHALESESPKARYYITTPTFALGTLKRLLPTTMLDRLLLKLSETEG